MKNGNGKKTKKNCNTCDSKFHNTSDCLHNILETCEAWERKTGKKWLTKDEYEKLKSNKNNSDSSTSKNKRVNLYLSSPNSHVQKKNVTKLTSVALISLLIKGNQRLNQQRSYDNF